MKLINKDYKKGFAKLLITDNEDLWALYQLINPNDIITSRTTRLVKKQNAKEGRRKPMTLKIRVKKTEWNGSELRLLGVIIKGPEDVAKGSHHSISLKQGSRLKLVKDKWSAYDKSIIKKNVQPKQKAIIITLTDSRENYHAVLKGLRVKHISSESSRLPRKDMPNYDKELINFYKKTIKESINLFKENNAELIVFAGPGFASEDLKELIKQEHSEILKKSYFKKASTASKSGINELIKGGAIKSIRKESRLIKETELIMEFFLRLKKEKLIKYGYQDVNQALESGAGEVLLLSEELIKEYKEKKEFKKIEDVLHKAEQSNTKIGFISGTHELGERFHKMGGIALLLRYEI